MFNICIVFIILFLVLIIVCKLLLLCFCIFWFGRFLIFKEILIFSILEWFVCEEFEFEKKNELLGK